MAANQGALPSQDGARWKRLLLGLCALVFLLQLFGVADVFGVVGRPWLGFWNTGDALTKQPFVVAFGQPVPGGAAARAGIRHGDTLDLREQSLEGRLAEVWFPSTADPLSVVIHRGARRLSVRILADSVWEVQPTLNLPSQLVAAITNLWFLGCALLIALRASSSLSGRLLAWILLLWAIPVFVVMPNPVATLLYFWFAHAAYTAAILLLIYLPSSFGMRYGWRRILEWAAYCAALLSLVPGIMWPVAALTLGFDPLALERGAFWTYEFDVVGVALPAVALAAVVSTRPSERTRAAWLLLPLPLSIGIVTLISTTSSTITSYPLSEMWSLVGSLLSLLGVAMVTYALLKRRVLDVGFILNRTVVVAIVSLIIVAAFVLLEWLLGKVITGVSHATGLVANAALALVIGVSIGYIHKGVDRFVDATFFRKRYQDEKALLDFSKEAAYVTNADSLLDQAIGQVARHTDARNAAILLEQQGFYGTARSFGDDVPARLDENDGVILALKTWRKPLDPHHYATALRGALVLPMLARGALVGLVVSGERAGGEAYAPDEVEALSQFAHGVGSALDSLTRTRSDVQQRILDELQQISELLARNR